MMTLSIVPCASNDPDQDLCWESAHETDKANGWKIDRQALANLIAAERADAARKAVEDIREVLAEAEESCDPRQALWRLNEYLAARAAGGKEKA